MEIRVLARQGKTIWEIARILGLFRNTVRRYLRNPGPQASAVRPPCPQEIGPVSDLRGRAGAPSSSGLATRDPYC